MNDDNIDGIPGMEEQNAPIASPPDPADEDIKITNTGQRIRAIAVGLIAVIAVIAAIVWYSNKQAEMARHEKTKTDFQAAHAKGYTDFWLTTQVDIKSMKSNTDLEARMKVIIGDDPVRYGRYIKEKCLPIIDAALPAYKDIEAPSAYADKVNAVAKAAGDLRSSWNSFADELLLFDGFIDGKKKLDDAANAWLGAQQSNDPKFSAKSYSYFKLLGCVLPDKKIEEIKVTDINYAVQDSCATNKPKWFRRVAFDCISALLEKPGEPNEAYETAITASRKEPRMDHASKFGIEDCLKSTRSSFESEIIEPLAKTWAGYVMAQNQLLEAVKVEIDKLK